MNKVLITTLLLCTGIIAAGCEKTYSVAEFKKDEKLFDEWVTRCGGIGTSKNCENLRVAGAELEKERRAKIEEENRKIDEKFKAEQKAWIEKIEADTKRLRAEREAKERAAEERRAKERAQQQQNNN
ncbi:EexN family lipoprotein [Bartonella sp. ML70XJBT]|uniref:EexN family lipoprotein n=1 Tax=Bartonella sp. ML70XJBT TaxID=3019096 RepID=UPI002363051D|nr:EexN family lipoprotein [Bartonella sp. ML70XJBT]